MNETFMKEKPIFLYLYTFRHIKMPERYTFRHMKPCYHYTF